VTSQRDLGPAALYTILLAYSQPEKCPRYVRVASDNKTPAEYANEFSAVSGREMGFVFAPKEGAWAEYEKKRPQIPDHVLGKFHTPRG
jgi:hypothetical protein